MNIKKYIFILALLTLVTGVYAQQGETAQKAINAEQYQSAKSLLKNQIRLKPKAGVGYYSLGTVYLKTGQMDSAKTVFTQGIRADAKNPLNYVGVGKLNLETENILAAKVNFDKAISLSARRKYEAHLAIGNAYLESVKPNFSAALPYIQHADALDKADKDARIFLALGDYYALQGQHEKALEQYTRVAQIDSTLLQVDLHIARMYVGAGKYDAAGEALQHLVDKDATFGPAFRLRSEIYQQQYLKDRKQSASAASSVESYRRYLDLTGRGPENQLNFALLLYSLGDFPALEAELSALTTLDPASSSAMTVQRLKGYAAYENGNYPAALQHMNTFFAGVNDQSKITADDYAYMSLIQQKLKLTDAAIESSAKAIKLDSSKTLALEAIAKEYYIGRNWEKTISSYEHLRGLGGQPLNAAEVGMFHGTALFFRYVEAFNKREQPSTNLLLQANALFDRVSQLAPDRAEAYLWSGRTLSLLEDQQFPKGAMVKPYQAYIETVERSDSAQSAAIKRNLVEASNAVAAFAAATGARDQARTYWGKALQLDPQNATAVLGMKALNGTLRQTRNR